MSTRASASKKTTPKASKRKARVVSVDSDVEFIDQSPSKKKKANDSDMRVALEILQSPPNKKKGPAPGTDEFKRLPPVSILAKIDAAILARKITFGEEPAPLSSDDEPFVKKLPALAVKAKSPHKAVPRRVPDLSPELEASAKSPRKVAPRRVPDLSPEPEAAAGSLRKGAPRHVPDLSPDPEAVSIGDDGGYVTAAKEGEDQTVVNLKAREPSPSPLRPRSGRKKILSEKARVVETIRTSRAAKRPARPETKLKPAPAPVPDGDTPDDPADQSDSWSDLSRLGQDKTLEGGASEGEVDKLTLEYPPIAEANKSDALASPEAEASDADDDQSGVMSTVFQDADLRSIYRDLPVLSTFCDVRPFGQANNLDYPRVAFASIREVFAESTIDSVIRGLVFDRSGFFVNTSRVDPAIFHVESRQLRMAGSRQAAVGIMLGLVTQCFLIAEFSVNSNYTVHSISIAPFTQEMRRDTSLWGQLFGFTSISGSVSADGLSFSTRAKTAGDSMPSSSFGSPTTPKRNKSSLLAMVKSPMASSRERVTNYGVSVPFEVKAPGFPTLRA